MKRLLLPLPLLALASCSKPLTGLVQLSCEEEGTNEPVLELIVDADNGNLYQYNAEMNALTSKSISPAHPSMRDMKETWESTREGDKIIATVRTTHTQKYIDKLVYERDNTVGAWACIRYGSYDQGCLSRWKKQKTDTIEDAKADYYFSRHEVNLSSLKYTHFYRTNDSGQQKYIGSCEASGPPITKIATSSP